ncbi:hypothetical protein F2Q70_00031260 [Brassica cretica]|uniref:Uncharacterized protein n=1 Tax=Brassica cretica TaxID=69181 RepID=A0A8S9FKC6_BRACR|nr:hypothetical protein F2Q70_00031260 [Brassica cretica]
MIQQSMSGGREPKLLHRGSLSTKLLHSYGLDQFQDDLILHLMKLGHGFCQPAREATPNIWLMSPLSGTLAARQPSTSS